MFTKLQNDKPFLKMAFQGFAGDGKTFTAAKIAIGLHKKIKSTKPIAIFDTERAAKALLPLFEAAGIEAVVNTSRTLATLNQAIKWCEDGGADILMVDSITHVWEDYLESYRTQKKRSFLQFQDWGVIKPKWKREFSNPFVLAKCHILFTGRAGYEYDETTDANGKKEIHKSGIKMKAENETAFEPDILVLMEKEQDILGEVKRVYRTATIIKDRTATIDGNTINADGKKKGPDFADFEKAINQLLNGTASDTKHVTIADRFEAEDKFDETKKVRERLISEIDGIFNYMGLSTGAKDKKLKAAVLNNVFGVKAIELLSDFHPESLKRGVMVLNDFSERYIGYLSDCANAATTPDDIEVGNLLKQSIEEYKDEYQSLESALGEA